MRNFFHKLIGEYVGLDEFYDFPAANGSGRNHGSMEGSGPPISILV